MVELIIVPEYDLDPTSNFFFFFLQISNFICIAWHSRSVKISYNFWPTSYKLKLLRLMENQETCDDSSV